MDATNVVDSLVANATSDSVTFVAKKKSKQFKNKTKTPLCSPNYLLNSAANKILRSNGYARWQRFRASTDGTAGSSNACDADEEFNNYLPADKVTEIRSFSPSAVCTESSSAKNSTSEASQKGDNFIFSAANEDFGTKLSPHLKTSHVKDNSLAAMHGSDNFRKCRGSDNYFPSTSHKFRSQVPFYLPAAHKNSIVDVHRNTEPLSFAKNKDFRPPYFLSAIDGLCKIPGCGRKCGPLSSYPEDLQRKVASGEFNAHDAASST